MSGKKLSKLFNLPFITSYRSGNRKYLPILQVETFLGYDFYGRLIQTYFTLLDMIRQKNYLKINKSLQENLANQICQEIRSVEKNRFKLTQRATEYKPKKQSRWSLFFLRIGKNVWDNNGLIKIGLQCNIYFGERFNKKNPLKLRQETDIDDQPLDNGKCYRIGQFRYIRWYYTMTLLQNIKNLYQNQTYELLLRYSSRIYLQVQNEDERQKDIKKLQDNDIMTEIVLRTGNQCFDWIIVDINGMKNKRNIPRQRGKS